MYKAFGMIYIKIMLANCSTLKIIKTRCTYIKCPQTTLVNYFNLMSTFPFRLKTKLVFVHDVFNYIYYNTVVCYTFNKVSLREKQN